MHVSITDAVKGFPVSLVAVFLLGQMPAASRELPAGPMANLKSEEFRVRESAQAEILTWARERPGPAMEELYRMSRSAADPEVRERCLAVLRELVNNEYLKDGEGYIGVRMLDETATIPGDPAPRSAIRVVEVVPGSAAHQAGLQLNDLIVGLDDRIWRDGQASLPFMEKVRQLKPGNRIRLQVLRNGEMVDVAVKLGRRPLIPDNPFLDQGQVDLEAAERMAKETYFRRWLDLRKAGHPDQDIP